MLAIVKSCGNAPRLLGRGLVSAAASRVARAEIGSLNVVAGSEDEAFGTVIAMYPAAVARVLEETGRTLGVDIAGLLSPVSVGGTPTPPGNAASTARRPS